MNLPQALQQASSGRLIGRRCWPASQVVKLETGISIAETIQLHGEVIHPLREGCPSYRPTIEDLHADDWIALD